jgi:hypothetical protein
MGKPIPTFTGTIMTEEATNLSTEKLRELVERIESGKDQWGDWRLDKLCAELHEIDERSNVNGTCAGYLYNLQDAKRFIPAGMLFSITHDRNEVRATVGHFPFERDGGFSTVPHGPHAEERALVAASLRAMEAAL